LRVHEDECRGRVGQRPWSNCSIADSSAAGSAGLSSQGILGGRSPARLVGAAVDEHGQVVCGLGVAQRAQQLQTVDSWHLEVGGASSAAARADAHHRGASARGQTRSA
jgi:hypothetical protein